MEQLDDNGRSRAFLIEVYGNLLAQRYLGDEGAGELLDDDLERLLHECEMVNPEFNRYAIDWEQIKKNVAELHARYSGLQNTN
ncbi:MAG TPA: hypothetical protein VK658_13960 [Chryseolinea sp.]|nr:hypothetical protein [Chryseolinea sp.]